MKLGYFCYGAGLARVVLYSSEIRNVIISFTGPEGQQGQVAVLKSFTPSIFVGPPMKQQSFSLEAWEDDGICGACRGEFTEGLQLKDQSGVFVELSPIPLTSKTISSPKIYDSPGLSPTSIALLSGIRKIDKGHIIVHAAGAQYWSDEGLVPLENNYGRRRITGLSLKHGAIDAELCCAPVAVASGPESGKTGLVVWCDNGYICIGGSLGDTRPAMFLPSQQS
jgi:hypothetical protein